MSIFVDVTKMMIAFKVIGFKKNWIILEIVAGVNPTSEDSPLYIDDKHIRIDCDWFEHFVGSYKEVKTKEELIALLV